MRAAFRLPTRWGALSLPDRTALYPALYLRWTGHAATLGRELTPGQWLGADLRVMVCDGALTDDQRELMEITSARGEQMFLLPQSGLSEEDLGYAAEFGFPLLAWSDVGPLSSLPPTRPGLRTMSVSGCAARAAEDLILLRELAGEAPPVRHPLPDGDGGRLVIAVENAAAFREVWPALEREVSSGRQLIVTSENDAALFEVAALARAATISPADAALPSLMADAEVFLCVYPDAAPESPRPGQWVRSALFAGAPVIAASHPSLDGLAHHCILDDWERGLKLYGRFAVERLKAVVTAQAELAERLQPERIAAEWTGLAEAAAQKPRPAASRRPPQLLALIDIHQDLDVLLPVLLALRQRGEIRLRIAVTDWLVSESPRILNVLSTHGFDHEVYSRAAIRAGEEPPLEGVDGVLSGAETNVRAHKSGHALVCRARERGLPTFTLQHGFENIGLTYKDDLHGEDVRFSSDVIFTWAPSEGLAPWVAPETLAAARPVGSPKTAPAPARAVKLNQGFWARTVGVFENLHWRRFSEDYRERMLADLRAAAAENPDTLFLIKPHHAGRWTSKHRLQVGERDNLVVIDPTDSVWEPHTAPALIASVDKVLTTPSTVALDAVRTGRPAAVLGYDLDLPLYEPLPIVRSLSDLQAFLDDEGETYLLRNETFLRRARLPGRADHRIAGQIAEALRKRPRPSGEQRRRRRVLVR